MINQKTVMAMLVTLIALVAFGCYTYGVIVLQMMITAGFIGVALYFLWLLSGVIYESYENHQYRRGSSKRPRSF